jgi:hypothetical protein
MLKCTFLGHQGWSFSSYNSHVLLDPILRRRATDGDIYPPREIRLSAMPPVAAVYISHSHEDHFDLPSIACLSRSIPIYYSCLSSNAVPGILREMGFGAYSVEPGAWRQLAPDLELFCVAPDHVSAESFDEWDVLPLVIRDRGSSDNFVSFVDVTPTRRLIARICNAIPHIGIWCVANNVQNYSYCEFGVVDSCSARFDDALFLQSTIGCLADLRKAGRPPQAIVICGGGWSLAGDLAYLNESTFPVDSERVAAALRLIYPGQKFIPPLPGQEISLECIGEDEANVVMSPFVSLDRRDLWPSRTFLANVTSVGAYKPFSGRCALSDDEWLELERELRAFAESIYSTPVFRLLYSLDSIERGDLRPTFVLALMGDEARGVTIYEYAPTLSSFVRSELAEPAASVVAGLECWATDLLELFRGDIPLAALAGGRHRVWSNAQGAFGGGGLGSQLLMLLTFYMHPLRRPARALESYRKWLLREERPEEPNVRGTRD